MGNRSSRVTTESNITPSMPSNLKLALQRITEFNDRVDEWQKWKNLTTCTFVGSRYKAVLKNCYE
eukprot:14453551-Ditylum_brightwellii.AAC.1